MAKSSVLKPTNPTVIQATGIGLFLVLIVGTFVSACFAVS